MIAVVLALLAAGATIAYVLSGTLAFGYAAVGLAILGLLCFAPRLNHVLRTRRGFADRADLEDAVAPPDDQPAQGHQDEPRLQPVGAARVGEPAVEEAPKAPVTSRSDPEPHRLEPDDRERDAAGNDEIVHVVPGRHRFHRPSCPLLDGKTTETLTGEEALEEGFTRCSRCF